MFCTESCEHGMNATSSGRVLGQCKSSARMQQEPVQMGQVGQLGQTLCLPQQPSCSMGCVPVPVPNFWLANDLESPRLGMCFVTERPEGLSIDCRVPIPSNFNLDERPDNDIGFLLMQSAVPPCIEFAKGSARTEKPAAPYDSCFPIQDNICAAKSKLYKKPQSCRKCQQLEQQELQWLQQAEQPQQAQQSQQAEQPQQAELPLPQQQQPSENTCRGLPSSLDNQLMGYLESIVEIMLAKRASSLQNQDEQPEQSCMGVFGLMPVQQAQQNDQQNFDPSYSNSPQLVPHCRCTGNLPTSGQSTIVRSSAASSQPVSADRSQRTSTGSAPSATEPQLVPHCACTGNLPTSGQSTIVRSSAASSQPVSADRSQRTSTGSAPSATEPQSSALKGSPSCYFPKKPYLENGAPSSYNDVETQTIFNSSPTCPTRSHVWHRPRCSHCFWYPTKIQR